MNDQLPGRDSEYFQQVQTQTGWGRTLDSFARWCEPLPYWLALDVGCGPGLLPAILARLGCTAVGVDLDRDMFHPASLHPIVAVADAYRLPFRRATFDLITCSNLVFMLPRPVQALVEMRELLVPSGKLAMLNPSELLNQLAAREFADEKQLDGVARATFLAWARRAEDNNHWTEIETAGLYRQAGMIYGGSALKVGPGFGRFSWGLR